MGDPVYDAYYASVVQSVANETTGEAAVHAAASELMQRIGVRPPPRFRGPTKDPCQQKAILVTHSQAGGLGWVIADARPDLVAHIIALEPVGPPFVDAVPKNETAARPFGLTNVALAYDPLVDNPGDIARVSERRVYDTSRSASYTCWKQAPGRVRTLKNLKEVRVTVVTSEASYHAVYDECTVAYLRQAGVKTDWIRLQKDEGIAGNGHLMFMVRARLLAVGWN